MNQIYILDACALLAVLTDEPGADSMRRLFGDAASGKINLVMQKLNLLEVYYDLLRRFGIGAMTNFSSEIQRSSLYINSVISDAVFLEAGRLKVSYKISLADSIALAEASVQDAALVTCDHHEFDVIEKNEPIKFKWIR